MPWGVRFRVGPLVYSGSRRRSSGTWWQKLLGWVLLIGVVVGILELLNLINYLTS